MSYPILCCWGLLVNPEIPLYNALKKPSARERNRMIYEELPIKTKLEWVELAIKMLALCPSLTNGISTENELIEKVDAFAKEIKVFYDPN